MATKLTPRQSRFVDEYVKDLNATQAAIRSGYSEKTAHVTGGVNIRNPAIKILIDGKLKERGDESKVTQQMVVDELAKIAFYTIDQIGPENIKIADKKNALDSLARHLGMFIDRQVIDMNMDVKNLSDDDLDAKIKLGIEQLGKL